VEQAYRNLHSAKIFLVDLLPSPEIAVLAPEVCARMAAVLDRNDPRRTEAEKALQSTDPAVVRIALKQALEVSYDAADEQYVRLRNFRNIVLATAATMAVFVILILSAVASSPDAIPLCFEPSVTGSSAAAQSGDGAGRTGPQGAPPQVCPSGDRQMPTRGDVLILAGLGAVGGGLSALLAIRNLRGTSTPYGVTMALAVLKVPSGALIALIGMLLLAGGFVPGLSNLDSQRQILAYALVFGYAQQLITRLADAQAQTILNRLPGKDSEAAQPGAQAASIRAPRAETGPEQPTGPALNGRTVAEPAHPSPQRGPGPDASSEREADHSDRSGLIPPAEAGASAVRGTSVAVVDRRPPGPEQRE
jgi:hypothetical protein